RAKPPPRPSGCPRRPVEQLVTSRRWLSGFEITEYFSVPERWFVGRRVRAPGIPGRHRVDWLYSSNGVAMEGDGIGLDGRHYHFADGGDAGWINAAGRRTRASACASRWSHGLPRWLEGGWRNAAGAITVPLEGGGWSDGVGVRELSYAGVTFAPGSSQPLHPYRTVAVDPDLIPAARRPCSCTAASSTRNGPGGASSSSPTSGRSASRTARGSRGAQRSPAGTSRSKRS